MPLIAFFYVLLGVFIFNMATSLRLFVSPYIGLRKVKHPPHADATPEFNKHTIIYRVYRLYYGVLLVKMRNLGGVW